DSGLKASRSNPVLRLSRRRRRAAETQPSNGEEKMRASILMLGAAGIMAATAFGAAAMDNMMMEKGMTIMVMPDGKWAEMKTTMDDKTMAMMKDKAKPMDKAMIMMMGMDGKMYVMEDTSMPDGKMASDAMMQMS